jgi:hypothetical protein
MLLGYDLHADNHFELCALWPKTETVFRRDVHDEYKLPGA